MLQGIHPAEAPNAGLIQFDNGLALFASLIFDIKGRQSLQDQGTEMLGFHTAGCHALPRPIKGTKKRPRTERGLSEICLSAKTAVVRLVRIERRWLSLRSNAPFDAFLYEA